MRRHLPPPSIHQTHTTHTGIGVALLGVGLIPLLQRLARPTISLLSGGAGGALIGKGVFATAVEYYCCRVRWKLVK